MSYGFRVRSKEKESRDFFEKAYRRETLAAWDAKWHALSVQARHYFLHVVKRPVKKPSAKSNAPSVSANLFPSPVLKELTAAGFVEVVPVQARAFSDRVIASDGIADFATRLHSMERYHLLAAGNSSDLRNYVTFVFEGIALTAALSTVLRSQQIIDGYYLEEIIKAYVINHRWPGWVAATLKDPLAVKILDLIRQAEGPVPLAELPSRIRGSDPAEVRQVVDKLIAHLVLVEDLQPKTWEILVGLVPAVREQLNRISRPQVRPPLLVCERPKEVGPSGSLIVNDLRAILLEIASEPPRVRQDQVLFAKEVERFQAVQEPLPAWLLKALKWSNESRVSRSIAWARALQLVKDVAEGKQLRVHLNAKGQKWLASELEDQYQGIYNLLNAAADRDSMFSRHLATFYSSPDPYSTLGAGDVRFLGEHMTVLRLEKGKRNPYYWDVKSTDHLALRTSLDEALAVLKPGVFYRLDSIEAHLVDRDHNPLNRGLAPDEVAVYWQNRLILPQEEPRAEAGRHLIDTFIRRRLIPLGCVQVAIAEDEQICIAREPRYDAYFDRLIAPEDWAPTSGVAARVVVQPDFSVIVIGLNPAPAAELAPFCERAATGSGQGALVLKITRESVVKAVSLGLNPGEIVSRLQRHASNEVPANVVREVEEWSNWVRRVSTSTLTVVRCPDQETADRVMSVLKRQAERLNNTLIAVDLKILTATERNKLRSQGIIVQKGTEAPVRKAKAKKPKSKW